MLIWKTNNIKEIFLSVKTTPSWGYLMVFHCCLPFYALSLALGTCTVVYRSQLLCNCMRSPFSRAGLPRSRNQSYFSCTKRAQDGCSRSP